MSLTTLNYHEYTELKQIVKQKGLLKEQPVYYIYNCLLTLGLLALSLIFLVVIKNPWLQLLNAAYLAFVFTQITFIAHDVSHRQAWKNGVIDFILGNLLLGISCSWWFDKHNHRHHNYPNQLNFDPDIEAPVLAFTKEQAQSKQGLARFIVKYQAYFFFVVMLFLTFNMRIESIQFLLHKRVKYRLVEAVLIAVHFVLYVGLLFYLLGVWQATLFIIIHQALFGLYMGSVFATNHIGMLMPDKEHSIDYISRQVLTTRNLKAHPLTDFWYGPLSIQIEHHLFPKMPRNKLREAQKIVKTFCQKRGIAYHETSVLQSYRELLQYLHQVSALLRESKIERKQ